MASESGKHLRVALWTPLPPLRTGVADYVAELLPYLHNVWDLEVFVDEDYRPSENLVEHFSVFPYTYFEERAKRAPFDVNVYEIGNNNYHWYIYQQAIRVPGIVVLHDMSLAYMLYDALAGREASLDLFVDELKYSEGGKAAEEFMKYYNRGDSGRVMEFFSQHPMLKRLAERSYGFVTHLEYNQKKLQEKYPQVGFVRSMHLSASDPYQELRGESPASARERLGFGVGELIVASFGFLQPTKQNDVTIKAFAQFVRSHPQAKLVFVGEINPGSGYDSYIYSLVTKFGLEEKVKFTGYVSRSEMLRYLLASDIVVNLRYPSFGEMSATLVRAIAAGKPVIITDLPEWRFLPGDFCLRVPPIEGAVDVLSEHLLLLAEDTNLRAEMGKHARQFYLNNATPEKAAEALNGIVQDVIVKVIPNSELTPTSEPPIAPLEERVQTQIARHYERWMSLLNGDEFAHRLWEFGSSVPVFGTLFFKAYKLMYLLVTYRHRRRASIEMQRAMSDGIIKLGQLIGRQRSLLREHHSRLSDISEALQWQSFPLVRIVENPLKELPVLPAPMSEEEVSKWIESGSGIRDQINLSKQERWERFYQALESTFRGEPKIIRERQRRVLDYLVDMLPELPEAPIVDLGCGRGEFLALLKERGIKALGVEESDMLVQALNAQGYKAVHGDILEFLVKASPSSLRGAVSFHVVEHLRFEHLMSVLASLKRALAPGGVVYLETPNPLSLDTLGHFYTDPTHRVPLPPFFLAFLLHYVGFEVSAMLFLEPASPFGSWTNGEWKRYYQDYGIVARKPKTSQSK